MANMNGTEANKNQARIEAEYMDEERNGATSSRDRSTDDDVAPAGERVVYRVYKIRWFGLMQLVLLNIVVSWDVSTTISIRRGSARSVHTVAFLLPSCQHSSDLLLDQPQHHQLAQHLLSLRLRGRLPTHNICPSLRRSTACLPRCLCSHSMRQLDSICRHTHLTTTIRCRNVRPNPYRSRSTFCSCSTNTVLRTVVQPPRPRLRNRNSFSSKSVRRCPRPINQSLPLH